MAQKDIAERYLEDYDDVFADIINVLLFQGRQLVTADSLQSAKSRTQYKAESGKLHEQERDVAKLWQGRKVRLALYGVENQTIAEKDMPIRVIGYDGAGYREQLLDKTTKERYPVITHVLYFGMEHWNQPVHLRDVVNIPEELEHYFNDYQINVFEIAWLTEEQVNSFQSDFRIVADYFTQKRKKVDYKPPTQQIKHVDAVLKMLSVFAQEDRFEHVLEQKEKEGEIKTMDEMIERIENRGIQRGIKQGVEQGLKQGIQALVETCQEIGVSKEDTIGKLSEKFGLKENKAAEQVDRYWVKS